MELHSFWSRINVKVSQIWKRGYIINILSNEKKILFSRPNFLVIRIEKLDSAYTFLYKTRS